MLLFLGGSSKIQQSYELWAKQLNIKMRNWEQEPSFPFLFLDYAQVAVDPCVQFAMGNSLR